MKLPITDMIEENIVHMYEITDSNGFLKEAEQLEKLLPLVKALEEEQQKKIDDLQHFKDSSVGLWCTDKPEAIPYANRHLFFQLK